MILNHWALICRQFIRNYPVRAGRSHLKRVLQKTMPCKVKNVEVLPNIFMNLDLRRYNQNYIFWFAEECEAGLQYCLTRFLPPFGTFVDIGANVGLFSLFAAKYRLAKRVIAVEPHPRLFRDLSHNVHLNKCEWIDCLKVAVSNFCGEAPFYQAVDTGKNDGCHSLIHEKNLRSIPKPVEVVTLDDVIKVLSLHRIDFLKIDVEGNEWNVLRGGKELFSKGMVQSVYCELVFILKG